MTPLEVHAIRDRGCWVVRLQDDIDHATVPYWKSVLDLLGRDARVALDLDAVRYVDSAGIALLLWLMRRLTGRAQLALARSPHFLNRIFQVAGIPALIPCYADLMAALDAISPLAGVPSRLEEGAGRAASP